MLSEIALVDDGGRGHAVETRLVDIAPTPNAFVVAQMWLTADMLLMTHAATFQSFNRVGVLFLFFVLIQLIKNEC